MISSEMKAVRNLGRAIGFLFLIFTPLLASAQVGPEMRGPVTIHLFGNYTYGSSNWSNNDSAGYTLGGFVQLPHLFGLESRGSYLHWGTNEHRYDALFGPRVALHFARFSPYGVVLGGVGHVVVWHTASPHYNVLTGETAPEWKVLGGVDFYAGRHFTLRLGEVSYAKVYVFQNGVSPIDFSGGVVYRIPVREH
jgi:hypothetical protein